MRSQPRETAFDARDHAGVVPSGASILVDKDAMDHLLDRLQNGDPALGWEGDPRFVLAWNRVDRRWELWRREHDEEYRLFARSKVDHPFPVNIIQEIMAHDVRRGFDPKAYVDAHNAAVDAEKAYQASQRRGPSLEKLAWALRKDDRTGAGL